MIMPVLEGLLQQDWVNSLGWALLHSLWQHALIALNCALLLFFNRQASANSRYVISFSCMLLAMLTTGITFYRCQQASSEIVMRPLQVETVMLQNYESEAINVLSIINTHIDSFMLVWLFGIVVCGLKVLLAYKSSQKLKNSCLTGTPQKWKEIFAGLVRKMGIVLPIELRVSLIANVPCVIGHIKPVVLLPIKLLLGMNQQQIEAIILHELAHIRRRDYLLGIIQTLINALFFFNPFLHWISSQIDKEREHACDDIAVTICQNPFLFANILKELAEMNANQKIAMKITGNKLLLTRITRLFNKEEKQMLPTSNLAASALILFASLLFAFCVNAAPGNAGDKTISLDVTDTAIHKVMEEVNKKCGTNEVLSTQSAGNVTLLLKDISCKDAIKLLKDFPTEAPAKE